MRTEFMDVFSRSGGTAASLSLMAGGLVIRASPMLPLQAKNFKWKTVGCGTACEDG